MFGQADAQGLILRSSKDQALEPSYSYVRAGSVRNTSVHKVRRKINRQDRAARQEIHEQRWSCAHVYLVAGQAVAIARTEPCISTTSQHNSHIRGVRENSGCWLLVARCRLDPKDTSCRYLLSFAAWSRAACAIRGSFSGKLSIKPNFPRRNVDIDPQHSHRFRAIYPHPMSLESIW